MISLIFLILTGAAALITLPFALFIAFKTVLITFIPTFLLHWKISHYVPPALKSVTYFMYAMTMTFYTNALFHGLGFSLPRSADFNAAFFMSMFGLPYCIIFSYYMRHFEKKFLPAETLKIEDLIHD